MQNNLGSKVVFKIVWISICLLLLRLQLTRDDVSIYNNPLVKMFAFLTFRLPNINELYWEFEAKSFRTDRLHISINIVILIKSELLKDVEIANDNITPKARMKVLKVVKIFTCVIIHNFYTKSLGIKLEIIMRWSNNKQYFQ